MSLRIAILIAAATLAAGCTWGPAPDELPVHARSAYGATVELLIEPATDVERLVTGELLYVEPGAVMVLTDRAIVRVANDRIRRWEVRRPGREPTRVWGSPSESEAFRQAVRYPRPLSEAQLRTLLEAHGFERVERIGDSG